MFQIFNTIDDKSYQMMGRSRKHRVHPADRSLRLKDVGAEDQGWYQCRLTTDFDTSSYNVSLEVLGRAPSILSPFSPLILMQGSNHSLRCEASGVPVPGITWTLNDQFLPEDNPRVRTSRRLLDGGGEGGAGNAVNVLRLMPRRCNAGRDAFGPHRSLGGLIRTSVCGAEAEESSEE